MKKFLKCAAPIAALAALAALLVNCGRRKRRRGRPRTNEIPVS